MIKNLASNIPSKVKDKTLLLLSRGHDCSSWLYLEQKAFGNRVTVL